MKTIKNIFIGLGIAIIVICFIVISIPFFIILSPIGAYNQAKFNREYKAYLIELEGKNFFCYNNRKKGRDYIEEKIIPNLPVEIEVLFLDGKKIETNKYERKYLSHAFYGFKNYAKFPHMMKVRGGEVIDCPLNSELFNCVNQGADEKLIHDKMDAFFELKQ